MSKLKYKCQRCGNYSVEKTESPTLSMLGADICILLLACATTSAVVAAIWLLLVVVITPVVALVEITRRAKGTYSDKYRCKSCGITTDHYCD